MYISHLTFQVCLSCCQIAMTSNTQVTSPELATLTGTSATPWFAQRHHRVCLLFSNKCTSVLLWCLSVSRLSANQSVFVVSFPFIHLCVVVLLLNWPARFPGRGESCRWMWISICCLNHCVLCCSNANSLRASPLLLRADRLTWNNTEVRLLF